MTLAVRVLLALVLLAPAVAPQQTDLPPLPGGKNRMDAILQAEHEKNLKDAERIQELSGEVEAALKKGGFAVLPVDALNKLDEIEKLARNLKKRLRK